MPSTFSADDLARVAQLARLALTDDEQQLFARQLAEFLDSADRVQHIDTTGIPPTSHPTDAVSPMRDDVERPSLPRAEVLAAAPDADPRAGLFKVPRVLG